MGIKRVHKEYEETVSKAVVAVRAHVAGLRPGEVLRAGQLRNFLGALGIYLTEEGKREMVRRLVEDGALNRLTRQSYEVPQPAAATTSAPATAGEPQDLPGLAGVAASASAPAPEPEPDAKREGLAALFADLAEAGMTHKELNRRVEEAVQLELGNLGRTWLRNAEQKREMAEVVGLKACGMAIVHRCIGLTFQSLAANFVSGRV